MQMEYKRKIYLHGIEVLKQIKFKLKGGFKYDKGNNGNEMDGSVYAIP